MKYFILVPNIPGNGGNIVSAEISVEISIPTPNIPGNSWNGSRNPNPFPL